MNDKIRILQVAQAAGGVDKYIQMLFKYMDRDKFENILICSWDYQEQKYADLVASFEQINMQRAIGLADLKAVFKVRKLIRKYHPEIVYAHSSKAGAITRIANIGMKNICIYNPHGWAFNMKGSKIKLMVFSLIEKIEALFCEKIICISEAEKLSALNKKICANDKLQVIKNGVDISKYEEQILLGQSKISRALLNIPKDAYIIGMVGRISPQKAPDTFINAAALIKKHISKAFFIIVGDGEQREQIESLASEQGLTDSLIITGWIDNVIDYIELFDIALLLSRWEGFGLVLAEYMIAGKPIIATKVDAIPEIINDEENGLLVNVDDVEAVYKSVIRLHDDEQLGLDFANKGLKIAREKYDARRVSKEHENLFKDLMSRGEK